MPELPKVSQDFEADATAYLAAIEEMIAKNEDLINSIRDVQAAIDGLHGKDIKIELNEDDVLEQVAYIRELLQGIPDHKNVMVAVEQAGGVKGGGPDPFAGMEASAARLDEELKSVKADAAALDEQLAAFGRGSEPLAYTAADVQKLNEALRQTGADGAVAETALAAVGSRATESSGGLASVVAGLTAARNGLRDLGTSAQAAGGWWGVWNNQIGLWAGLMPGVLGHIRLWHVLLDGAVEATVALVGAAAALGAGLAAIYPTAEHIVDRLNAIHTVSSALGQSVPPLSGKFAQLQNALAPQVVEMYGGALNAVNSIIKGTNGPIANIVTMFDDWIAKIDLYMQAQGGMNGLLKSGQGFLQQFASFLGEVGIAINNLVKSDPGTAHFLLDLIDGFGKVLDVITSLPSPILMAALALHSIWLWGGLLVQWAKNFAVALLNVGIGLTKFVEMLPALAANPLVWVVAAAAGIAYLGYQMTQASSSAKAFINNMNQGLANDTFSQAILDINTDIGKLNQQIQFMSTSGAVQQIRSQWSNLGNTGQSLAADTRAVGNDWSQMVSRFTSGNFIGSLAAAGRALEGVFVPGQGAAVVAKNNIAAFDAELKKLVGDQGTNFRALGDVMTGNFTAIGVKAKGMSLSYAQALGVMDAAGVKTTDNLQQMLQKVYNMETGFANLGVRAGLLGNAINALTFSTEMQDSKIQQVTQAFSQFIGVVTGGQSAFISFAQQVQGTFQAAGGAAASLSMRNGQVSTSIKNLGGAAGPATVSMNGLTTSSLNLRQSFIQSITDGSNVINTLLTLSAASAQGAKGTAMVTQAGKDLVAQMLPLAKGSRDATTELYTLAQTAGYQGADSFKALSQWVGNVKNPMENLNSIESKLMGSSATLSKDVQSLATAIGQTLNQAMAAAIFQAQGGQAAFNNFANAALHAHGNLGKMHDSAQALANELITTMGNTAQAKAEFETFAGMLGISKTAADKLWNSLATGAQSSTAKAIASVDQLAAAIRNLPSDKYITIHEGTVNYTISAGGAASPHAAGYLVPGYGGGDRHLALLEGGEAVVPKELTSTVAPFLKAHGVPGFASGGIITGGTTKEAKAAIAQDMAMLARFFPNAPIPHPAAAPPQFLGEWLPSSMIGVPAPVAAPPVPVSAGGGTPTGGGNATGHPRQHHDWWHGGEDRELHSHITVNLDGKKIWQGQQKNTLRYNIRNNGIATGLQKPR